MPFHRHFMLPLSMDAQVFILCLCKENRKSYNGIIQIISYTSCQIEAINTHIMDSMLSKHVIFIKNIFMGFMFRNTVMSPSMINSSQQHRIVFHIYWHATTVI